jgi:hypothetical protein
MSTPVFETIMSAAKHSRSTFGCSEHNTFDKANGSMGITRVGK